MWYTALNLSYLFVRIVGKDRHPPGVYLVDPFEHLHPLQLHRAHVFVTKLLKLFTEEAALESISYGGAVDDAAGTRVGEANRGLVAGARAVDLRAVASEQDHSEQGKIVDRSREGRVCGALWVHTIQVLCTMTQFRVGDVSEVACNWLTRIRMIQILFRKLSYSCTQLTVCV